MVVRFEEIRNLADGVVESHECGQRIGGRKRLTGSTELGGLTRASFQNQANQAAARSDDAFGPNLIPAVQLPLALRIRRHAATWLAVLERSCLLAAVALKQFHRVYRNGVAVDVLVLVLVFHDVLRGI